MDGDVVPSDPRALVVTSYRYRANRIPAPWAARTEEDAG